MPPGIEQIIFSSILLLGSITKCFMTGHKENSKFCLSLTVIFPSASPRETFKVLGKQNSMFPLGASHYCAFQ